MEKTILKLKQTVWQETWLYSMCQETLLEAPGDKGHILGERI